MKKLLSLILALAMAFALSAPAFAEGTTTTVTLDLLPTNTYTLTVPAATVLNKDGSAVALTNGLKVSNGDLASDKKVVVTASADSGWKMSATGATTKVGYGLYAQANDSDTTTAWEYSAEEANTGDTGTTKTVYAKANTTDVAAAAHGEYSDTITFTSEVKAASAAVELTDVFNEGTVWTVAVTDRDAKYEITFKTLANGFECTNVVSGGVSYPQYVELVAATRNGSQLAFSFGYGGLTIDTAAKTYSMSGEADFTFNSLVVNGTDLVSQLTKA